MKILIVSEIWTHPVDMGNKRLITDQAKYLSERGHEVHFLFIDLSLKKKIQKYELMSEFWGERLHILSTSKIRKIIYNLKWQAALRLRHGHINADTLYFDDIHNQINALNSEIGFDCCIINYFYLSKALEKISIKKKVLLTHDIFSNRNKNGTLTAMSTTQEEEKKAAKRAQYILTVQKSDTEYFKQLVKSAKVLTIFSSFKFHETPMVGTHNILFLSGSASFNILGLNWFFEKVWMPLKAEMHDIQLLVAGGICEKLAPVNIPDDVILLGYINDIESFFKSGDIFINPTYLGTGLKIKTLESVAFNKISITRNINRIGLPDEKELPIYFSDSPEEWISYIKDTIGNHDKIAKIKRQNQKYISHLNDYIDRQYDILLT